MFVIKEEERQTGRAKRVVFTEKLIEQLKPLPKVYDLRDINNDNLYIKVMPNGKKIFNVSYYKRKGGVSRKVIGEYNGASSIRKAKTIAKAIKNEIINISEETYVTGKGTERKRPRLNTHYPPNLRSRTALLNVIGDGDIVTEEDLSYFLDQPVDLEMLNFFVEQDDSFRLDKRIAQEHTAHFIFKHLVRNNVSLGDEDKERSVVALAGNSPLHAVASYLRRGLLDKVHFFEKDQKACHAACEVIKTGWDKLTNLNKSFWRDNSSLTCTLYQCDYLELDNYPLKNIVGFILDHCGMMSPPEKVASLIEKNCPREGVFFIETTYLDGRWCACIDWEERFEKILVEQFKIRAKDSYDYKGGSKNCQPGRGSPMKTYIWILERKNND